MQETEHEEGVLFLLLQTGSTWPRMANTCATPGSFAARNDSCDVTDTCSAACLAISMRRTMQYHVPEHVQPSVDQ